MLLVLLAVVRGARVRAAQMADAQSVYDMAHQVRLNTQENVRNAQAIYEAEYSSAHGLRIPPEGARVRYNIW